jgi:hypothetical protein
MPVSNRSPEPDRQPRQPAADRPTSGNRGRRARPGAPRFTFQVRLVGGEEGRRLEQQQTEAIIEVLRWLAAHRPTPTAATQSPRRCAVDDHQHRHQRGPRVARRVAAQAAMRWC